MEKRYYFAYGSNCNLEQMAYRCPNAKKVGAVTLPNYRLTFNGKKSGWGVANIRRRNGATVHGLLWEITPGCEKSLDRYEGYPTLYTKKTVTVQTDDGSKVKAMVYVMTKSHHVPAIPVRSYLMGIVDGFEENGMDAKTVWDALEETEAECGMEGMAI